MILPFELYSQPDMHSDPIVCGDEPFFNKLEDFWHAAFGCYGTVSSYFVKNCVVFLSQCAMLDAIIYPGKVPGVKECQEIFFIRSRCFYKHSLEMIMCGVWAAMKLNDEHREVCGQYAGVVADWLELYAPREFEAFKKEFCKEYGTTTGLKLEFLSEKAVEYAFCPAMALTELDWGRLINYYGGENIRKNIEWYAEKYLPECLPEEKSEDIISEIKLACADRKHKLLEAMCSTRSGQRLMLQDIYAAYVVFNQYIEEMPLRSFVALCNASDIEANYDSVKTYNRENISRSARQRIDSSVAYFRTRIGL